MSDGERKVPEATPPAPETDNKTEKTEIAEVEENTDAQLMWINLDVIQKDIASKLPPDAVEIVMARIEKIIKPWFMLQAKWIFSMISWFFKDNKDVQNKLAEKEWDINSVMASIVDITGQVWKLKGKLHDTILSTMWWEAGAKFATELATVEEKALEAKKTAKSPWEYRDLIKPLLLQFASCIATMNFVKPIDPTAKTTPSPTPDKVDPKASDSHEWFADTSHYTEEEKEYINNVIDEAKAYEWTKYLLTGLTKYGIDCSGLWSVALKKEFKWAWANNFPRLTAALFDNKAPDIEHEQVEKWDWMFREDPNWVKWHKNADWTKIYHIEMALWKVYERDGKKYVLTYGSSSDAWYILKDWVEQKIRNWVWYRERKIDENKHFARPEYYTKLVTIANGQATAMKAAA
jgi:hypothetical protein